MHGGTCRGQAGCGSRRRALVAVDIVDHIEGIGGWIEARPLRRTQIVACHPHEPVRVFGVGITILIVAVAETAAARTCCSNASLGVLGKTDFISAVRPPYAVAAQAITKHPGFPRTRKGILGLETEIAYPAAFSEQHQVLLATRIELDIGDGMAVASAGAKRRVSGKEGWQDELAPHIRGIEVPIAPDADRPDRVSPVLAAPVPLSIAERRASPDRIIKAHVAAGFVAANRKSPDPPTKIGVVPALRALLEIAGRAVLDPGTARRVECDRGQRRGCLGPGIDKAVPA